MTHTPNALAQRYKAQGNLVSSRNLRRLRIEALEDRRMLTTITVTNLSDSGAGSLRQAILDANSDFFTNTIDFSVTGTISLGSQLPRINSALSIIGPGQDSLVLDAGGGTDGEVGNGDGFRIFHMDDGLSLDDRRVVLSGLTLTGGDPGTGDLFGDGGAIHNSMYLTISASTITGNAAARGGGGIHMDENARLYLNQTSIEKNVAAAFGGGILTSFSEVTIDESVISGNSATLSGGGIFASEADVSITSSTLSGNAAREGGAINNFYARTDLTDSVLSNNSGTLGGAIYNRGGMTITGSVLSENIATQGGAIYAYNIGGITISESMLSGNSATESGGGLFNNSNATILASTLSGNTATDSGGGIFNEYRATIIDSTLSGNSAGMRGGGLFNGANGSRATIRGSTLAENAAGVGGGIYESNPSLAPVILKGSIVANSLSGGDVFGFLNGSVNETPSDAHNLIEDGSGLLNDTIVDDPKLGPLADNGGPTLPNGAVIQTHALLPGSLALDSGGGTLHYYRFEGDATDSAGSSDGTASGAVVLSATTDVLGSSAAASFAGGHVEIGNLDAIGSTSHTVEAWVNIPSGTSGRVGIILGNFVSTSGITANWEIHDDGELRIYWDGGNAIDMRGSTDLRDTGWRHLVFVRDTLADEFRAYIDGQLEVLSNSSSAGVDLEFIGNHRIGNDNRTSPGRPFQGSIDELAIYDRALTEEEILARAQGNVDQRGLPRWVGRIDIGAYEAQVTPSADFDSDGDVDGADFLAWQRGSGILDAALIDGDSDGDNDVDASDLAAWQVSFGQPQSLVAELVGSELPAVSEQPSAVETGKLVDAAMAWALLDVAGDDAAEAVFGQQTLQATTRRLSPNVRSFAPPPSRTAYRDVEIRSETDDTDETWLSDKVLERVFG